MKSIKQPLINTLRREGVTPPKGASFKKLVKLLTEKGWHVEVSIRMTKSTTMVTATQEGGRDRQ